MQSMAAIRIIGERVCTDRPSITVSLLAVEPPCGPSASPALREGRGDRVRLPRIGFIDHLADAGLLPRIIDRLQGVPVSPPVVLRVHILVIEIADADPVFLIAGKIVL